MDVDTTGDFDIWDFLDKTYPTEDDSVKVDEIKHMFIDKYSSFRGSHSFLIVANTVIDSISRLCSGLSDMDNMNECDISTVESLCKIFNTSRDHMLKQNREIKFTKNLVLHLDSLADASVFYDILTRHDVFKKRYVNRLYLQRIYEKQGLESKYSHVLFCLSWMNFVKVYHNQVVRFNNIYQFR